MGEDVFISYRRETGRDGARILKQALEARGFSVFFDYDSLRDGLFDRKIFQSIDGCRVFVAFYSAGSLDRCVEDEDWVRAELEYARRKGKKIVPVASSETLAGWRWPENLPESLGFLRNIQISRILMEENFNATVDEFVRYRLGDVVPAIAGEGGSLLDIRPSETVPARLKRLAPTERERDSGYAALPMGDDFILMSERVNRNLRGLGEGGIHWREAPEFEEHLKATLMERGETGQKILARKRALRGAHFRNERKIGLATDLLLEPLLPTTADVFRTDYHSSFLTNELATLDVYEEGAEGNERIWAGHEHFPWRSFSDGTICMQPFTRGGFSNHLGGNTLGITDDGRLVLWLQSGNAERSHNRWAPTGSGSLDWEDLDAGGSLLRSVANGAERELREESCLEEKEIPMRTKVIGFFRWCSRGGLPGFCCVTRVGCRSAALSPNSREVCIAKRRPLLGTHPAGSREELADTIQYLLGDEFDEEHQMSTPLLANLLSLRQALEEHAPEIDFLFDRTHGAF